MLAMFFMRFKGSIASSSLLNWTEGGQHLCDVTKENVQSDGDVYSQQG